jgi:maleylpyruvate isomerase
MPAITVGATRTKRNSLTGTVNFVTIDPLALAPEIDLANARLLNTVSLMTPPMLAEPSLLPGWTRGHVLAHLSRNADALGNLLTWAATGVVTPAYASPEARTEGIEAGAYRSLPEQIDDLTASCDRLGALIAAMPAAAWPIVLGDQGSAAKVVWRRLREVEVHHVDLGLSYRPADWSPAFALRLLHEAVADRPRSDGNVPSVAVAADELAHTLQLGSPPAGSDAAAITVSGPANELAAWLCGRSDGSKLSVSPAGPLPTLSNWM